MSVDEIKKESLRDAVIMALRAEGLRYEDIAELLDVSPTTVGTTVRQVERVTRWVKEIRQKPVMERTIEEHPWPMRAHSTLKWGMGFQTMREVIETAQADLDHFAKSLKACPNCGQGTVKLILAMLAEIGEAEGIPDLS